MKKRICIMLALTMLLSGVGGVVSAETETYSEAIKVVLNGAAVQFDVPPILVEDRTQVPMRQIFEMLDYEVSWDEENQCATAVKEDATVRVDVAAGQIYLGNSTMQLNLPVQVVDGRTMVPLRFIAYAIHCDVLWDGSCNTVYLETDTRQEQALRPDQSAAVMGDEKLWTSGREISLQHGYFEEVPYANSNSLQYEDGFLYYRNEGLYLCRANVETGETEQVAAVAVGTYMAVGGYIYYSKLGDSAHNLYRAEQDGSGETLVIGDPCGDFRVLEDRIYYIHMHTQNLMEYSMVTGETKTIYDGWTSCFDVSADRKVYYGMASYTDERTPLIYRGLGCYDSVSGTYETMEEYQAVRAGALWIVGNNLFYQTPAEERETDLYRCSLQYGYQIKLLSGIYGGAEIHGDWIFYYPVAGGSQLYMTDTSAGITVPLFSFVGPAGTVENVTETIGASEKFSQEEIQAAMDVVLEVFKGFCGCELTELWYDEDKSNREIESYMKTGKGAYNGAQPEQVIVLLSNFNTGDQTVTLNPNSRYTNWMWILIREDENAPWQLDDSGY